MSVPLITGSSPVVLAAPLRLALLKLSVVFASETVPLVPRAMPAEVKVDPVLSVEAPAMMRLLVMMRPAGEIRLSALPVFNLTVAEPSESATAPTSRIPSLIVIVPVIPGLAAVRMRLPPPSLVKPLVATKTELMTVLSHGNGPRTPPACVAMTGEIGRLLPSKPASSVMVPPETELPLTPNTRPPTVTPKPVPSVGRPKPLMKAVSAFVKVYAAVVPVPVMVFPLPALNQ